MTVTKSTFAYRLDHWDADGNSIKSEVLPQVGMIVTGGLALFGFRFTANDEC
jgi:hypothetical protein